MRRGARFSARAAVLVVLVAPLPLAAQVSEVAVEVGGSRILPPPGVEGDAAAFLVGGMRARHSTLGVDVYASVLFGGAVDSIRGGDFLMGELGGAAWRSLAPSWSAGVEGRVSGFRVGDPFPYRAGAVEGSALLRWRAGGLSATLAGVGGVGRSSMTITSTVRRMRRELLVEQVLEDDLWRGGGTLEVLVRRGAWAGGVAGGVHASAGGTYRSAGARLVRGAQGGALELRADVWRTPGGTERTAGLGFHLPWGAWSVRGVAGRPEPDPLLMTEPAAGAGGLLLGRRLLGHGPADPSSSSALHRLTGRRAGGARVRFAVEVPGTPGSVALLGDFTLWEPVPMVERAGAWTAELEVASGTHHFGFLVDGEWYLPDDAPDAVPDEWGRRSATLVVEGENEGGRR